MSMIPAIVPGLAGLGTRGPTPHRPSHTDSEHAVAAAEPAAGDGAASDDADSADQQPDSPSDALPQPLVEHSADLLQSMFDRFGTGSQPADYEARLMDIRV
jgi:hypothetical protein